MYALKNTATGQVISIGSVPSWATEPPAGCECVTLINAEVPQALLEFDPISARGELRLGIDGIVTVDEGVLRRMTDTEINAAGLLGDLKRKRCLVVDLKTRDLIVGGFDYDNSTFSSTERAQQKLTVLVGDADNIEYPLNIAQKDDTYPPYSVADKSSLLAVFSAMRVHIQSCIDDGETVKAQIRDATTYAEAAAVEDNR